MTTPTPAIKAAKPPYTVVIANLLWGLVAVVSVTVPFLAIMMLQTQYKAVSRDAELLAGFLDYFDFEGIEMLQSNPEFFSSIVHSSIDQVDFLPSLFTAGFIVAAISAVLLVVSYLIVILFALKGYNWARVTGTVFTAFSLIGVFALWVTLLTVMWVPISALQLNHTGLVILCLQIVALVFIFLPQSNTYYRDQRTARDAARLAKIT